MNNKARKLHQQRRLSQKEPAGAANMGRDSGEDSNSNYEQLFNTSSLRPRQGPSDNRPASHSFPPTRHPRQRRCGNEGRESEKKERGVSLRLVAAAQEIDTGPIMALEQAAVDEHVAAREPMRRAHVDAERDGHGLDTKPVSPAPTQCKHRPRRELGTYNPRRQQK